MALFLRLLLGHLLGDFAFQPGRLVRAKRTGRAGQAVHAAIVTACTALALFDEIASVWPAVLAAGAAHLAIEHVSVPARNTSQHSGLLVFMLDQGLHVLSLVLIALAFPTPVGTAVLGIGMSLVQLALFDAVIAAALMGSIIAFEARTATKQPDGAIPVLRFDPARAYGMVERAAALLVGVLSPFPAAGLAVFAPRILYAIAAPPEPRARHLSEAAVGAAMCTVLWALVVALSLSA